MARRIATWSAVVVIFTTAIAAVSPSAAAPTTRRIAGEDRFDTAAAVSRAAHATPPVTTAFVATGNHFADALGAGPAAASARGPVLITRPDSLPGATRAELERLQPDVIVVVGGETAVNSSVYEALRPLARRSLVRWSGGDRFATAAAVSAATFSPGGAVAYIANGERFADALAGGAAAGAAGGPVLLVTQGSLPPATRAELSRLKPSAITVLGATSAISDSVVQELSAYAPTVGRSAGADRFATSVAISQNAFGSGARVVVLAAGADYPDALAGVPFAAAAPGPILLVRHECVPGVVNAEIDRLAPETIVVLGGPNAVSAGVESRTTCPTAPPSAPPPTATTFTDGTHRVGVDIPPGTYREVNHPTCYWARLSGFGGTLDEVKANELTGDGPAIVTIDPSDAGFRSERCGTWSSDLRSLHEPSSPLTEGTWQVGSEVASGTWRNSDSSRTCYWARLRGFSGELDDIITNGLSDSQQIVNIAGSDVGFTSERCGTWTKIG